MGISWPNVLWSRDYAKAAEEEGAYSIKLDLVVHLQDAEEWNEARQLLDEARGAVDAGDEERAAEKLEALKGLLRARLSVQGRLDEATETVLDTLRLPGGPGGASTSR